MDHSTLDLDQRVRLAAFAFLAEQSLLHGQVLPYATLLSGFTFEGTRVPLLGPQGIFKPARLPGDARLASWPVASCAHASCWTRVAEGD